MARQLDIPLTGIAAALDALRPWTERAAERARTLGRPVLAAVRVPLDPADDLLAAALACPPGVPRWYLHQPAAGRTWLGLGAVAAVRPGPACALGGLADAWQAWRPLVETDVPEALHWVGGAAFDTGPRLDPWRGWPSAEMWLPRVMFTRDGDEAACTVAVQAVPGQSAAEVWAAAADGWQRWSGVPPERAEDPGSRLSAASLARSDGDRRPGTAFEDARDRWMRLVAETASAIRAGRFDKVVLAREEVVPLGRPADIAAALRALGRRYPESGVFALWRGDQCFLGATPERLARVGTGIVEVDCLAGTAPRGRTPAEDARLADWLLHSGKNLHEHGVVREWLRARLAPLCTHLEIPAEPGLKRLANVQHLHTPLAGRLRAGQNILTVADALMPTPALAGAPQKEAMAYIRDREGFDRGWYGGAIGWAGMDGSGEFMVAIRCALVGPVSAHLYAGAGIMGDSDPAAEWEETVLKLRPMKQALGLEVGDDGGES
jgi:salicylate biosynthesis isochorismate synthase